MEIFNGTLTDYSDSCDIHLLEVFVALTATPLRCSLHPHTAYSPHTSQMTYDLITTSSTAIRGQTVRV